MIDRPWVSVVMPSLNQASFIGPAIDSVLKQDYPHVELIVADGGSTDGTLALLEQRSRADLRLRWSSMADSGPASGLNRALGSVRGSLIGWLNSDDLYTPGAIARAVDAMSRNPACLMVYGHGQHVDADGGVTGDYPTRGPDAGLTGFVEGCYICQPTVFFRRTFYVMLGDLDEQLKTAFDLEYWLRAFHAFPHRIGFVDAVQARSRLHPACITRRQRREVELEGMQVLARYFGAAPASWLLHYMREMLSVASVAGPVSVLRQDFFDLIDAALPTLSGADVERLRSWVEGRLVS